MNIFVARLSYQTTEDQLRQLFEAFGTVESAKVIFDKIEGRSKGYGFVEMTEDSDGLKAIEDLNDSEVDGRRIIVKQSQPKEPRRDNFRSRRY